MTGPTPEEVEAIRRIGDPVLRNLRITLCYSELSVALADRLGPSANWCTFATWASRQAGRTIRGQDLDDAVGRAIDEWLRDGGGDAVLGALHARGAKAAAGDLRPILRDAILATRPGARASAAVALGNLEVFQEIAVAFARFLPLLHDDDGDARFDAFLDGLRPGGPPDGQGLLRQAFAGYRAARGEADPTVRAQRILLANLEVGYHEQQRLQPRIQASVDAVLPDARALTPKLLAALLPMRGAVVRARRFLRRLFGGRTPLDIAVESMLQALRPVVRRAITDRLMTLDLAGTPLRLGRDHDAPFPASLAAPSHPALLALLDRIDPTPDSTRESGARDWTRLDDRMHYIADLFRCYQETAALFDPPFAERQVAALRAGRLPAGPL